MTTKRRDLIDLLHELLTAYGKPFDDELVRIYQRSLGDIPLATLELAFEQAINTRRFLPTLAELREDIAACTSECGAGSEFKPCTLCVAAGTPGWHEVPIELHIKERRLPDGTIATLPPATGMVRCECYERWRAARGLSPTKSRSSLQIDKDRAIGAHDWSSTADVAASSSKVKRFQRRVAGGKR
jgi:hypothetical protein